MTLFHDEMTNRVNLDPWQNKMLMSFQDKMTDKNKPFPCIPATQGFSLSHLRYGFIGDPRDESNILEFASILTKYTNISRETGEFSSLIIFFETPEHLVDTYSVEQFEQLFWKLLSGVSALDTKQWPTHIPTEPEHPLWEFCYNGEQYFMYCATPAHQNRRSRNFPCLMLAITPRWVLQNFNSSPSIARKIKSKIRTRLKNYDSVPVHPDLKSYGKDDNFEWKQYFLHDDDTSLSKCPYHRFINSFKSKKSDK